MIKDRFLHTVLLCLLPLMGWGQNFSEMVADMSELSLPLVNIEVEIDSVSKEHITPGKITLAEYKDNMVKLDSYDCQVK